MKVLIIEDEPATANRLAKMLTELEPGIEFFETIDTVEESVLFFHHNKHPDLIFMDIHLADGNSFEIFEQIKITNPIIFTTAYDQYAIKAFKVNSIDYLLKPIRKEDLSKSLEKYYFTKTTPVDYTLKFKEIADLLINKNEQALKRIVVKAGAKITALNITEVAYFNIEHRSVNAVLFNGRKYPVDFTMEQLELQLNSEQYFRINRSFIINFDAIKSMISYSKSRIKIELITKSNDDVITSSDRSANFKIWLRGK